MKWKTGFTPDVVAAVSLKLKLPSESWMQDWPLEVSDPDRIDEFLTSLEGEVDRDQQEAIAALLGFSIDDALSRGRFLERELLERAGKSLCHRIELIEYWSRSAAESPEEGASMALWMRTLRGK